MLPSKKTERIVDFAKSNTLIYGLPKVGKSSFCANIPNALFLTTEEGHKHLEIFNQKITCWEDLQKVAAALKAEKHEFKTLIVDVADILYKQCEHYVLKKIDKDALDPSDIPYGKGFRLIKDEFTRAIYHLNQMGFGMVFLSHAKERELKTKTEKMTYMDCTLGGSASSVICGLCDYIFYFYINSEGKRLLRTKPTKNINAGDRSGKLPEVIPLDYTTFIKFYEEAMK